MTDRKHIVLYRNGCGINTADLKALREAGFIPLKVNDLNDVRVIDPISDVDHGVIFNSALKAIIGANKDVGCRTLFGQSLAEKLLAIQIPKPASK